MIRVLKYLGGNEMMSATLKCTKIRCVDGWIEGWVDGWIDG